MATCSTCGARMVWAVTEAGKPIPLDSRSTPNGNLVVEDLDAPELRARAYLPLLDGDAPRFTSHFATCPDAALHRKRGR